MELLELLTKSRPNFTLLIITTTTVRRLHYIKIVTIDVHRPEKEEIVREILSYLSEHPDAQDTLEGIIQWWLLERKIKYQKGLVQEALAELVAKGSVDKHKGMDSRSYYQINRGKRKEADISTKEDVYGKK